MVALRSELWVELNNILKQEEIFWFQKSRCNWLKMGDRNTKFFHASTIIRRKKNKIIALKDNDDCWVTDPGELKQLARDFYSNLFSHNTQIDTEASPCLLGSHLQEEDIIDVERPVSDGEIKEAMFSMGPLKAPGVDGLHAIFFQSQWNVVADLVCSFVRKVFADPYAIKEVNQTLLVLIPKCEHLETLKEMRPISLCKQN